MNLANDLMKNSLLLTIMALSATAGSFGLHAEELSYTSSDGAVYTIDTTDGTAVLSKVAMETMIMNLTVPDELAYEGTSYPVVGIGASACANNSLLTTATLGANVTTIEDQAFSACGNLREVTLPAGLKNIRQQAFYNCKKLAAPALPEGLESIGNFAFWSNNVPTQINLPASLTHIGSNPWGVSTSLATYTIGDGAEHYAVVDGVLFTKDMTRLISYPTACPNETYTVPEAVKVIANNSMRNNSFLKSVTLNEGLDTIATGAFNVGRLTSISIPESVRYIAQQAFVSNSGMQEYIVAEGNQKYRAINKFLCTKDGKTLLNGVNIPEIIVPESIDTVASYAFYKMTNITNVKLSNTKVVGQSAFYQDMMISELDLGQGLDSICTMAFMYCSSVKSITFPSTFRAIANRQAFLGCSSLESATFNEGIERIGDAAFMLCSSLKKITIPGTVTKWGNAIFNNCAGLTEIEFCDGLTEIGSSVVAYCNGLTKVKIANSVKNIQDFAFGDCSGIQEINIPTSLETVGDAAFQNVPLNRDLELPEAVTKVGNNSFTYSGIKSLKTNAALTNIGNYAFGGNEMTTLELNEGLESIGLGAFASCPGLSVLVVPSTVTTLGDAFANGCEALTEIHNLATTPQALTGDPVSESLYETCKLIVPMDAVEAYKAADFWKKFRIIEGSTGIADIILPDSEIREIYNLSGIRLDKLTHGVNIVRYSDGSVRKIVR